MRSSASLAMGEPVAAWTSKNLRRTCAQQPASAPAGTEEDDFMSDTGAVFLTVYAE